MAEDNANTQNAGAQGISDWNFFDDHVETNVDNEQYIGAHSVLVAAGPPELSKYGRNSDISAGETGGGAGQSTNTQNLVYPIGVLQNVAIQQNRGLQRLFEVGSARSYFVPGRTSGSLSVSRVMFHGKSLLRVLSAYYYDENVPGGDSALLDQDGGNSNNVPDHVEEDQTVDTSIAAGSDNSFYINLASELFERPLGLMFYIKDNEKQAFGQFYLENVFIGGHNMQLGAGSTVVSEGAQMQFDTIRPIKFSEADS